MIRRSSRQHQFFEQRRQLQKEVLVGRKNSDTPSEKFLQKRSLDILGLENLCAALPFVNEPQTDTDPALELPEHTPPITGPLRRVDAGTQWSPEISSAALDCVLKGDLGQAEAVVKNPDKAPTLSKTGSIPTGTRPNGFSVLDIIQDDSQEDDSNRGRSPSELYAAFPLKGSGKAAHCTPQQLVPQATATFVPRHRADRCGADHELQNNSALATYKWIGQRTLDNVVLQCTPTFVSSKRTRKPVQRFRGLEPCIAEETPIFSESPPKTPSTNGYRHTARNEEARLEFRTPQLRMSKEEPRKISPDKFLNGSFPILLEDVEGVSNPKLDFVDSPNASARCSSENDALRGIRSPKENNAQDSFIKCYWKLGHNPNQKSGPLEKCKYKSAVNCLADNSIDSEEIDIDFFAPSMTSLGQKYPFIGRISTERLGSGISPTHVDAWNSAGCESRYASLSDSALQTLDSDWFETSLAFEGVDPRDMISSSIQGEEVTNTEWESSAYDIPTLGLDSNQYIDEPREPSPSRFRYCKHRDNNPFCDAYDHVDRFSNHETVYYNSFSRDFELPENASRIKEQEPRGYVDPATSYWIDTEETDDATAKRTKISDATSISSMDSYFDIGLAESLFSPTSPLMQSTEEVMDQQLPCKSNDLQTRYCFPSEFPEAVVSHHHPEEAPETSSSIDDFWQAEENPGSSLDTVRNAGASPNMPSMTDVNTTTKRKFRGTSEMNELDISTVLQGLDTDEELEPPETLIVYFPTVNDGLRNTSPENSCFPVEMGLAMKSESDFSFLETTKCEVSSTFPETDFAQSHEMKIQDSPLSRHTRSEDLSGTDIFKNISDGGRGESSDGNKKFTDFSYVGDENEKQDCPDTIDISVLLEELQEFDSDMSKVRQVANKMKMTNHHQPLSPYHEHELSDRKFPHFFQDNVVSTAERGDITRREMLGTELQHLQIKSDNQPLSARVSQELHKRYLARISQCELRLA